MPNSNPVDGDHARTKIREAREAMEHAVQLLEAGNVPSSVIGHLDLAIERLAQFCARRDSPGPT